MSLKIGGGASNRYTLGEGGGYVHTTGKETDQIQADDGRRGGAFAARFWFRQHFGVRPVPAAGRFPQRRAGRLSGGVSMASAPRDRDDYLCARGNGGARRQHGEPRGNCGGRRPVDDGGQRDYSPRDAQGRPCRTDARVSVVGQPAVVAEDDGASLSRGEGAGYSGDQGRRWHARARGVRSFLGEEWTGGRHRCRSYLSGCVRAAGTKEDAASGSHAAGFRVRVRGRRKVLQCVGTPRGADRTGKLGGHETVRGGGQPFTGAV